MRQAFLMHMDDFDRLLKTDLARLLDPIVGAVAPPRRRERSASGPLSASTTLPVLRAVTGGLTGIGSEVSVLAEPVVVPVAVSTSTGTPAS